jgi:tRNA(fMet)-specific endonuclease VapC
MPNQYLLDTNISSYLIKGNVPAVRLRLNRIPISQISISAVTEGELRYGVARLPGATKLRRNVEEFLRLVTVLPWDSAAALHYGNLRAELEKLGQPIGNFDMLIGAHALAVGAVLVTSDLVFSRIKNLKVENWTT